MPRQSRFLIIWQNRINFSLCQPRILHTVLKQTQQKKGYIHPVLLRYRTLLFEYHLRSDHNYEIGNESLFLPLQTAVLVITKSPEISLPSIAVMSILSTEIERDGFKCSNFPLASCCIRLRKSTPAFSLLIACFFNDNHYNRL